MPLPIAAAAIMGGASLVGGILANKSAKNAARRQMDFQERMSNTQYQRGMEDMRKAGLNPMLAYSQGGASSPGGATYTPRNVGADFASGALSGMNLAQTYENVDVLSETAKLKRSETELNYSKGMKLMADENLTWEQIKQVGALIEKTRAEIANLTANTDATEYENTQRAIMSEFYDSAEFFAIAQRLGIKPESLKSIFAAFFSKSKK